MAANIPAFQITGLDGKDNLLLVQ